MVDYMFKLNGNQITINYSNYLNKRQQNWFRHPLLLTEIFLPNIT